MKKLLASVAALAALSAAAPAFAAPGDYGREAPRYSGYNGGQYDGRYGGNFRGSDMRGDFMRIEAMINQGVRNGSIDRREVRMLYAELRDLRSLHVRLVRNDGRLGMRERVMLERRIDALRANVWRQSRDRDYRGDRRYDGYGRGW